MRRRKVSAKQQQQKATGRGIPLSEQRCPGLDLDRCGSTAVGAGGDVAMATGVASSFQWPGHDIRGFRNPGIYHRLGEGFTAAPLL